MYVPTASVPELTVATVSTVVATEPVTTAEDAAPIATKFVVPKLLTV